MPSGNSVEQRKLPLGSDITKFSKAQMEQFNDKYHKRLRRECLLIEETVLGQPTKTKRRLKQTLKSWDGAIVGENTDDIEDQEEFETNSRKAWVAGQRNHSDAMFPLRKWDMEALQLEVPLSDDGCAGIEFDWNQITFPQPVPLTEEPPSSPPSSTSSSSPIVSAGISFDIDFSSFALPPAPALMDVSA
jgi:hypothetical protein